MGELNKKATVIRVAAIIIKEKKILLVKGRVYNELWTPGGKITPGETDEQCLRRELREEVGVELRHLKYFGEYAGLSPYHNHLTINRMYFADIEGEPEPASEIESVYWLNRDDVVSGKYAFIPLDREKILPDIMAQGLL